VQQVAPILCWYWTKLFKSCMLPVAHGVLNGRPHLGIDEKQPSLQLFGSYETLTFDRWFCMLRPARYSTHCFSRSSDNVSGSIINEAKVYAASGLVIYACCPRSRRVFSARPAL
jgi:hypothetical protein